MIEDWLGEFKWPAAIVTAAIVLGVAWWNVNSNDNETQLKRDIVEACAQDENVDACVKEMKEAL